MGMATYEHPSKASPVNRINNNNDGSNIAARINALDAVASDLEATLKLARDRLDSIIPSRPECAEKRLEDVPRPSESVVAGRLREIEERLRNVNEAIGDLLARCEC